MKMIKCLQSNILAKIKPMGIIGELRYITQEPYDIQGVQFKSDQKVLGVRMHTTAWAQIDECCFEICYS